MQGYKGIGTEQGIWVPDDAALSYALARCGVRLVDPSAPEAAEFCDLIKDWFFSGNFYHTQKEEPIYD